MDNALPLPNHLELESVLSDQEAEAYHFVHVQIGRAQLSITTFYGIKLGIQTKLIKKKRR